MRRQVAAVVLAVSLACVPAAVPQDSVAAAPSGAIAPPKAVLWTSPEDIPSRDLFYGPGGKENQPKLPVSFVDEELHGTSPKFNVRDADGKKWKAKIGPEARPETVASRLLWAVGYSANENYLLPELEVEGLPQHLQRGDQFRDKDGKLRDVRLQRHPSGEDKADSWSWVHNPFRGTREFNGLRVMMALLDNWDLKDENNALFVDKKTGVTEYAVTDVGATFGPTHQTYSNGTKGNLKVYRNAHFITKVRKNDVDFGIVGAPGKLLWVFNPPYTIMELHQRWIGKHVPREDARWIGSLLAQLSPQQVHDAFRAGGYPPEQVDAFANILQERIAELQKL